MTFLLILVAISCLLMIGFSVLDVANNTWEKGTIGTMHTARSAFTVVLTIYFICSWLAPTFEAIWK